MISFNTKRKNFVLHLTLHPPTQHRSTAARGNIFNSNPARVPKRVWHHWFLKRSGTTNDRAVAVLESYKFPLKIWFLRMQRKNVPKCIHLEVCVCVGLHLEIDLNKNA